MAAPENASVFLLSTSPSDCDVAAAAVPFDPELCTFGRKQNEVVLLIGEGLNISILASFGNR